MKVIFRAPGHLLGRVREDLRQPHPFAAERVGFLLCRPASLDSGLVIIASSYHRVADDDYLDDPRVGAMMGPSAIRKAMQVALTNSVSMFHVHMHEHQGMPRFSSVDRSENAKFVPDFFNVTPRLPHGALVLSFDGMTGLCWTKKHSPPIPIAELSSVGAPIRFSWG